MEDAVTDLSRCGSAPDLYSAHMPPKSASGDGAARGIAEADPVPARP